MDSGEELEARELETIRDVCVAHGLELSTAYRRGVLLILVPRSLDEVPDSGVLRQIAEALAQDNVRYVALSLDEDGDEA